MSLFAILAPLAISAVGSYFGSKSKTKAIDKASGITAAAADRAMDISEQRYGEFQSALSPFLVGGTSAYNTLLGQYGIPTGAPGATAAPQAPSSEINIPQFGGTSPFGIGTESGFGRGMFGGEPVEARRRTADRGFPEAGAGGITPGIPAGPTDLSQTPAFQIPFNVGMQRAKQDLASQGLLFSGPAIQEYMDQAFSTYYGDLLGGITGIAGAGQGAATSLGTIGQGQAAQTGNILGTKGADLSNLALGKGGVKSDLISDIFGLGGKAIGAFDI